MKAIEALNCSPGFCQSEKLGLIIWLPKTIYFSHPPMMVLYLVVGTYHVVDPMEKQVLLENGKKIQDK